MISQPRSGDNLPITGVEDPLLVDFFEDSPGNALTEDLMSAEPQLLPHVIELRPRAGTDEQISVGANAEVLLDGRPLRGCRKISIEAEAGQITIVKIELLGIVNAKVLATPEFKSVET